MSDFLRYAMLLSLFMLPLSLQPLRADEQAPKALQPVTLHLVGDSTMSDKPNLAYPERGWGQRIFMPNSRMAPRTTPTLACRAPAKWPSFLSAI
ncbi:hypothetical protein WG68_00735 [Arsukibacterium ikkense]|uniref:SGNH hydrolase-type esterase domain-containing protein n=1 Tax=Arsukibacterium ikkense TaxID=336831 RepID=A0A0M2VC90_9GAMM|nr:hypothetical protein [Arsukibacterium ikkense]KKO47210.1 hypothetical protein WG68_00735 [Arsukibacterium ikkense]